MSFNPRNIVALLCLLAIGCSRLPGRIPMTKMDPGAAASEAIKLYDTSGDGMLDEAELELANGLNAAKDSLDANSDGNVDAAEIESRLNQWLEANQALIVLPCEIKYRGQLLADATVTFIPEPFLGPAFKRASGVTDGYGVANVQHAAEDRPDPDFPQGVRVGFYRLEISKEVDGKEKLPPKFNVESRLGQEVAPGAVGLGQGVLRIDLR